MKPGRKRIDYYYKIFEQIYEDPFLSIYDISRNTGLARNTVAKYLHEMYEKGILRGPSLSMKPASNYGEYVYLLKFTDPLVTMGRLKEFPHVLYNAATCGDWNTVVVTDHLIDFSRLVGFQKTVYQGERGCICTPKAEPLTWDECFKKASDSVKTLALKSEPKQRRLTLPWGQDEWLLFHTFKNNLRQTVTPLLKKIHVRYETYLGWIKTLPNYCSIHTRFYPYGNCGVLSFVLFTDYDARSVFSFPVTPFMTEVGSQLFISVSVPSFDNLHNLFCTLYDLEAKKIIKTFIQAVVLFTPL